MRAPGGAPAAAGGGRPAAGPALAEQVAARLATLEGERGSVTIRLDPPELGQVVLRFVRRGDRLHVRVHAQRAEVAALLGQESGRLEASCSRQGTEVRVEVAAGDPRKDGDPSRETGGRRRPAPGESAGPAPPGRIGAAAPLPASPGSRVARSLLDVVG